MKLVVMATVAALIGSGAAAADPPARTTVRATTAYLDSFVLSPTVQYPSDTFWCEFNNYAASFSNYDGRCPTQDFVATLHWKKIPNVTEYDVCLEPSFGSYTPGFACQVVSPPTAGNPASLSYTFDSARDNLNATQGTTQTFMVVACNLDANGLGPCSESDTVSAVIPWTG